MKQKGFTLIELLAVIVIMAIIAVITVPMIMNVIDKAKIGALEDSAYGMVESANLYYAEKVKDGIDADLTFTPNTDSNGMFAGTEQLNYKGSLPESGSEVLIKTNGNVGVKLISGDYCAVKSTTETKVTILKNDCVTNIDGTVADSESGISALQSIIGSTDISSIGDGTVTGALSELNENVNGKVKNFIPISVNYNAERCYYIITGKLLEIYFNISLTTQMTDYNTNQYTLKIVDNIEKTFGVSISNKSWNVAATNKTGYPSVMVGIDPIEGIRIVNYNSITLPVGTGIYGSISIPID